jgi:hypothetical protein
VNGLEAEMADEQREENQAAGQGGGGSPSTGDPGRTPDKAEGSEETVDESLKQKGEQ